MVVRWSISYGVAFVFVFFFYLPPTYLDVNDVIRVAPVEHRIGNVPEDVVSESSRILDEGSSADGVDGPLEKKQHHRRHAEEHVGGRSMLGCAKGRIDG